MAGFEYQKVRSAPKKVLPRGVQLRNLVLRTMQTISSVVGDTLGPGGRPVLIERHEQGLPPTVTKDGVTVFRSLGFEGDEHVIMEAARDASVRTAADAGDGTTTATVLSEALVRLTTNYCEQNRRVSPQRVVERLRQCWRDVLEPTLKAESIKVDLTDPKGWHLLRSVAKVSGNGDTELADAVLQCYREVGDDGNVTIVESAGHESKYEVERINGYPVATGYEQCCGKFSPEFVNDQAAQRCYMPHPAFVVFHGRLHSMNTIFPLLQKIGEAWVDKSFNHNIVVVATDFSEDVLAHFALNFKAPNGLNLFPLAAPLSPSPTGQLDFLRDVCAVTGAQMFDPLTHPFDQGDLADLGPLVEEADGTCKIRGVEAFEATRFRSNIIGHTPAVDADPNGEPQPEDELEQGTLVRIRELNAQLGNAGSELDAMLLRERIAKLAGGIAKLKVIGSSNGEMKERRDRAEDAVCAVRGAIKHGILPGGGWALLRLRAEVSKLNDPILNAVLVPALEEPLRRLLQNAGLVEEEEEGVQEVSRVLMNVGTAVEFDGDTFNVQTSFPPIGCGCVDETPCELGTYERVRQPVVYDAAIHKYVNAFEGELLDAAPAVGEALRNAISIAGLLGTLGGMVVFRRDAELERDEARATEQFLRDAQSNPADERA